MIQEFQLWCIEFQNPRTRATAEKNLIAFRQHPNIFPTCVQILGKFRLTKEQTRDPNVLFQLGSALKEIVAREYHLYDRSSHAQFQQKCLDFLLQPIPKYVSEQFYQLYAIIEKRGWLEASNEDRQQPFNRILQLLNKRDTLKVGFGLLNAFLDEFSSNKASAVGLSLFFHYETRKSFEETFLKQVVLLVLDILQQGLSDKPLLLDSLSLAEKIITWHFEPIESIYSSTEDFAVPLEFSSIFTRKETVDLFFNVWNLVKDDCVGSLRCRACLIQLASMPITDAFVQNSVILIKNFTFNESQISIVTQIVKKILPQSVSQLIESVCLLSTNCIKQLVNVDELESSMMECVDDLLSAWSSVAASNSDLVRRVSPVIYECYILTRLELASRESDEELVDETNFKDRDLYMDQLVNISVLARIERSNLGKLLECYKHYSNQLIVLLQQPSMELETRACILNEQITWILLLLGHFLADDFKGETPSIPLEIDESTSNTIQEIISQTLALANQIASANGTIGMVLCSPLVCETLVWFIQRFTATYTDMLIHGLHDFFVLLRYFCVQWKSEPDVLQEIFSTFIEWSKRVDLSEKPEFVLFLQEIFANLDHVPPQLHILLVKTLIVTLKRSTKLLQQLETSINGRLQMINTNAFIKNASNQHYSSLVIHLLEMFEGLACSMDQSNTLFFFDLFKFSCFEQLMQVYNGNLPMQSYIIRVYSQLLKYVSLQDLDEPRMTSLLHSVLRLGEVFSAQRQGVTTKIDEDHVMDILQLVELAMNLLENYDMSVDEFKQKYKSTFQKVVLCITHALFPLLNPVLLESDALRLKLLMLFKNIALYFPEKLNLEWLMQLLRLAFSRSSTDDCREGLDCVANFVNYCYTQCNSSGLNQSSSSTLLLILDSVLQLAILKPIDSSCLSNLCNCLFLLILTCRQKFIDIMHQLLANSNNPRLESRVGDMLKIAAEFKSTGNPLYSREIATFTRFTSKILLEFRAILITR